MAIYLLIYFEFSVHSLICEEIFRSAVEFNDDNTRNGWMACSAGCALGCRLDVFRCRAS